jgi:coenzyme F420-reducing hydrogenase delta subunit
MSGDRKEKIVLYCCENSSYKAFQAIEDSKGLDVVEAVPLPCSGKMEIGIILKSLEEGYAGVLILGCPKDNCKFIRGNYRAEKRIEMARDSLERAGLSPDRVHIDFLSSVDHHKCRQIIEEMAARLFNTEGAKA